MSQPSGVSTVSSSDGDKWVIFDMDDVLVNLREAIQTALHRYTKKDIPWTTWDRYELHNIYEISHEDCLAAFLEHGILEAATLEPGALKVLQAAKMNGYKTSILTARGWHPEGAKQTIEWMARMGVEVDKLVLVPLGSNKADMLHEFGLVHLFVDDHPKNLEDMTSTGQVKHVILRDRPWNKNRHEWPRINHLDELACWLDLHPSHADDTLADFKPGL
jgi:5'(3')-deoxyribonucleotidase